MKVKCLYFLSFSFTFIFEALKKVLAELKKIETVPECLMGKFMMLRGVLGLSLGLSMN